MIFSLDFYQSMLTQSGDWSFCAFNDIHDTKSHSKKSWFFSGTMTKKRYRSNLGCKPIGVQHSSTQISTQTVASSSQASGSVLKHSFQWTNWVFNAPSKILWWWLFNAFEVFIVRFPYFVTQFLVASIFSDIGCFMQ